jgi:CheY-like chemotaxis protein
LLEDEEAVRQMLRRVLEAQGYTVLEARDGAEARLYAEGHSGPIDLLITDVVLPRMTGVEAARAVLSARPGLRVLFISGYANSPLVEEALSGVHAALPKPFTATGLAQKVREVLDCGSHQSFVDSRAVHE